MAHSQFSISTGDLSSGSPLLKHPAFVQTPSLRRRPGPVRHNSIPVGFSYVPLVKTFGIGFQTNNERKRALSLRETCSKSLMNIDRPASSSTNSSEPESPLPLDNSNRQLYWSSSHLHYYTKTGWSPRINSHKHLQCQLPSRDSINNMDHYPKKYLSKSPSVDSGTASGSIRRRKPTSTSSSSPGRKRHSSGSSVSLTSSSSLGSFKEKMENTEPVEVIKKRSSLSSLISRKSSIKLQQQQQQSSGSKKQINENDNTSFGGKETGVDSSPSPSSTKVSSSLRESLKAAKNLLTHQKINTDSNKSSMATINTNTTGANTNPNSPKISSTRTKTMTSNNNTTMEDSVNNSVASSLTCLKGASPIKNLGLSTTTTKNKLHDEDYSLSASVSSVYKTSSQEPKSQLPTGFNSLPNTPSKKSKEKSKDSQKSDSTKSPAKKVSLGKLLSKKMRAAAGIGSSKSNSSSSTDNSTVVNKNSPEVPSSQQPEARKSPEIVNFEKEPRKLVPKPKTRTSRIVIVGRNNRGFNEMEVSEEALILAKKLREQQEQEEKQEKEEKLKQERGKEIESRFIEEEEEDDELQQKSQQLENEEKSVDYITSSCEKSRKPPIARPRRLSSNITEVLSDTSISESHVDNDQEIEVESPDAKERGDTTQEIDYDEEFSPQSRGQYEEKLSSNLYEMSDKNLNLSPPCQSSVPKSIPNSQSSTIKDHHRHHHHHPEHEHEHEDHCKDEYNVIDGDGNKRNNSSLSKHTAEFESGIGIESPVSSLDEQIMRMYTSSPNTSNDNRRNSENYDEETEVDEEDTSMATTVTTTASEMDASFMLSRSIGLNSLTEDEFSYTESFKQLKPFNFDHVDPIPEGKRERLYKVLVVGELGTGKTSIIKRYVHQFFSQHYRATIGVDFALKVLRWDPETVVRLQLWDIAGQERFGSMTRVYYKEAVGAFVVFDVTRSATLEAVPKWKADLDTKVVLPDGRPIPTVLLANKSDQPKEGIAANREKMNEFCQQQGFSAWFETSAKDNINIDESANFLVSKILDMDKWSQEPMTDPEKLELGANGKHKPGSSNCAC